MNKSAALLIQNADGKYLLIQRTSTSNHFKGQWEYPGGGLNENESPQAGVAREVREELGLRIDPPSEAPLKRLITTDREVEYAFFFHRVSRELGPIVLSSEHESFKWASFTEVRKLDLVPIHREFLEWHWLQGQIKQYESVELSRYRILKEVLEKILRQVQERWAPLGITQVRAKKLDSFAEKCLRKADKYDDPVHQLTDLCGGRIVTATIDEADTVCRQIRKLFAPVDEEEDKRRQHGTSGFGYLSVHFLVHFPEGMTELHGVAIPPEVVGLKAEIQVRTLLQHAHSEITHDRLYKAGYRAPAHCEREAARVAAALESADEQFARFVNQLDAYVGHYAAHLNPEDRKRQLADLALIQAEEKDPLKRAKLGLRVARLNRSSWDWVAVADALHPFAKGESHLSPWIGMELGNALCRLNAAQPHCRDFLLGLDMLEQVARPQDAVTFMEKDERECRATALAWLGQALARSSGHRNEARQCLAKAVELSPNDPYQLVSFLELDIVAGNTSEPSALVPLLHQAAGRCLEHIQATIEITRAWFTLTKIRLLLNDESGAVEALCLAARSATNHGPLRDFHESLNLLQDAIGDRKPFVSTLSNLAAVLAKSAEQTASQTDSPEFNWHSLIQRCDFDPAQRVLLLAGSTSEGSQAELDAWEEPLKAALTGFDGYVLTGGTSAGVCGLAARITQQLNSASLAQIKLVGYLPASIKADSRFGKIVRTTGKDFSIAEPAQMWSDLLTSKVQPDQVSLLCLGGGNISAQELALAWALHARTAAIDDGSVASKRFSQVIANSGGNNKNAIILPNDPATIRIFSSSKPKTHAPAILEEMARVFHSRYVNSSLGKLPENMRPWEKLSATYQTANLEQARFVVEILRAGGFDVRPSTNPKLFTGFTEKDVEFMAELEHGRWNVERLREGWRYGNPRDNARKLHNCLIPWKDLPEDIREYDRESIRVFPEVLAKAGLEIVKK